MKELYTFSDGDDHYALDVRDMAFFQISEAAREILDRYPRLDPLETAHSRREIRETVEALAEVGIFDAPDDAPQDTQADFPSPAALEAPLHLLEQATDFLRSNAEEWGIFRVVARVALEENGVVPPTVFETIRGTDTIVSIEGFPRLADLESLNPGKRSPVELRVTVAEICAPDSICRSYNRCPAIAKTVVSIDYQGEPKAQLATAIRRLGDAGFKQVALEALCAGCRGKGQAPPVDRLHHQSLVNATPYGMSILTSGKNIYGCGAGSRYLAVSDSGALYPCRHYLGKPEFRLGNLEDGIALKRREALIASSVDRIPQCRDCGIRYLCGGPSLGGRTIPVGYCRAQESLARQAMVDHSRMDLIQKAQLKGTFQNLCAVLPTRPYFYPQPQPAIQIDHERTLAVHGNSMRPLLREGDKVLVIPLAGRKIKNGNIVCFGKPVTCHRVVRIWKRNGEIMVWEKGDNSLTGGEIPASDIHGIVTAIVKTGGTYNLSRFHWRIFGRIAAFFSRLTMTAYRIFNRSPRSERN